MKKLGLLLLFLVGVAVLWSIHVKVIENTQSTITATRYRKMLGVGIDVDWMTFPKVHHYYFYWRSKGVSIPKYFKEMGFSNVRIRVSQDVVTNRTALVQLGEIVRDCLKAGLIPIITYTAPELRENPTSEETQEHFVLWWKTVAEYFKGTSYLLSYDLLIESSGPIKEHPEVLNRVYAKALKEIREIDPHRLVFVTPVGTSSPFYLEDLNISNDGFTLAEWHIYAGGPKHCTYNESPIRKAISEALNWSRKTGIPTWVGAWRPFWSLKNETNCSESLILKFSTFMASSLKEADIPYDINSDVWFFNIENLTWKNVAILETILPLQRKAP
ncbi:glycoside hydrolase family 5 protein [Thermococcus sp.]